MIYVIHMHIHNANSGFHEGKRFSFNTEAARSAFLLKCIESPTIEVSDVTQFTEQLYTDAGAAFEAAERRAGFQALPGSVNAPRA